MTAKVALLTDSSASDGAADPLESAPLTVTAPPRRKARPQPTTPKVKPRTKSEQRAETLEHILDAAEALFGKHGLYGVTLKDVAGVVGVHTSLLHYYFDSKQALFDAVVARRAPITSNRRLEAMDRYEAECGGTPTVEGALHVFLDTDLDLYISGGEGWRNYGALGAQINNAPVWGAATMGLFDPVVMRLISLLKKAMPHAAEEDIFWGYHFVTGALTLTLARTGRIDKLSGGLCDSNDFEAVKARMAPFMAAGFIAVCERRAAERAQATPALPNTPDNGD
jgi:AcrR family transcriptional regulator